MPFAPADVLQPASVGLGNLSLSLLVGGVVMPWASGGLPRPHRALHAGWRGSGWAARVDAATRRMAILACAGLALAQAGLLWWEAAAMGDVPLAEAASQVGPVLSGTRFGAAWLTGALGLVVVLGCGLAAGRRAALGSARGRGTQWALCGGLVAIVAGRAMAGHAGSTAGPVALAMDFVHVLAGTLWAGVVLVGAWIVFRAAGPGDAADRGAMRAYVETLSTLATAALVALVVTGAFATWRALAPAAPADIAASRYGQVLAAKLVLAGLGAVLGAHNRFREMPALLRALGATDEAPAGAAGRFRRILCIEAVVLLAVLAAAALLATSAPPG